MSGLELVAGIAGVAAAAIKVSVAMNDLAEELGSAGRDVRYIANDMAGFSQVLRLVQSSFEESIKASGSTVVQSVFDTLPQLVEQCTMVYDEANGLMVALKPSTGKDSSISFFQRMKFVFYKGRITILRSLLDSSKSTLNLLLVTLNIEMAKSKSPSKAIMEQLQNERKAFIKVVYSQNKALDEAMKEVEKAKKEAAKFKNKRDKEKEKEKAKEEQKEGADPEDTTFEFLKRNSTPYSYKPPPPYALHSTPSVSQLVYQPPSLERFNSVRKSSKAVTTLALSLEPVKPASSHDIPTPSSPPVVGPRGSSTIPDPFAPQSSSTPPRSDTEAPLRPETADPNLNRGEENNDKNTRPTQSAKRVFSDPGPGLFNTAFNEHLHPGSVPRERSRSPYGYSRVPQDESPKVERKRPSFQSPPNNVNSAPPNHRTFSTPAYGSNNIGSVPEETEPFASTPQSTTASPDTEQYRKSSFTYHPPPPPPPIYTEAPPTPVSLEPDVTTPREPAIPPPPPPRHGTSYIVLTPYLSDEIGHLSLVPFDTLVDVVAHISEDSDPQYPQPQHYWQASLGDRRGPRGLFPCDVVCSVEDERITAKMRENWFANGEDVGFIANAQGRCWVGPNWEWKEPLRRRSKWWAEEF